VFRLSAARCPSRAYVCRRRYLLVAGLETFRADRADASPWNGGLRPAVGWTLARAHARSGDRVALAAYLGGFAKFDQAIAEFAETYADQNERDYAAFQTAVKDGTAQATTEI
jgi:hypothetical protein